MTLDELVVGELVVGHATYAGGVEVGFGCLDAAQTAELLVPWLLPLGNQVGVGVALLEQPVVQLARDGLALVKEVVDVPRPLVVYLEDGRERTRL